MMDPFFEAARLVLPVIVLVVQVVVGWAIWSLSQKFVTRTECVQCREDIEEEQAKSEERVKALEHGQAAQTARDEYRVTTGDLEKIYERINAVDRKVSNQSGEFRAMRRDLALINQHLLETK